MPKVLMIEPDVFFATICERSFREAGIELIHVMHGEEIHEQVIKYHPDLVILAIALAKKSGFEVLEELREDERTKQIPVMIFSHLGNKEDVNRCFQMGACEYLIKSQHSPEDLVRRVKKTLEVTNFHG